jgi:hypothetical protein
VIEAIVYFIQMFPKFAPDLAQEAEKHGQAVAPAIQEALQRKVPTFKVTSKQPFITLQDVVLSGLSAVSFNTVARTTSALYQYNELLEKKITLQVQQQAIEDVMRNYSASSSEAAAAIVDLDRREKQLNEQMIDSVEHHKEQIIRDMPRVMAVATGTIVLYKYLDVEKHTDTAVDRVFGQCPAYDKNSSNVAHYACRLGKWGVKTGCNTVASNLIANYVMNPAYTMTLARFTEPKQ